MTRPDRSPSFCVFLRVSRWLLSRPQRPPLSLFKHKSCEPGDTESPKHDATVHNMGRSKSRVPPLFVVSCCCMLLHLCVRSPVMKRAVAWSRLDSGRPKSRILGTLEAAFETAASRVPTAAVTLAGRGCLSCKSLFDPLTRLRGQGPSAKSEQDCSSFHHPALAGKRRASAWVLNLLHGRRMRVQPITHLDLQL